MIQLHRRMSDAHIIKLLENALKDKVKLRKKIKIMSDNVNKYFSIEQGCKNLTTLYGEIIGNDEIKSPTNFITVGGRKQLIM